MGVVFLAFASELITSAVISSQCRNSTCTSVPGPAILGEVLTSILLLAGFVLFMIVWMSILIKQAQRQQWTWFVWTLLFNWIPMLLYLIKVPDMNNDPKQLQPSPDGQHQPPLESTVSNTIRTATTVLTI
jgi:hypothetical protein